jgi:ATP-binding cassette, subfamily B, bacterial
LSDIKTTAQASTNAQHRLEPLLVLWPHLWRYPLMVWAAFAALILSAAAMLTLPVAARRMIDFGFSEHDQLINLYFGTLVAIGLVLALASAGRF